MSNSNTIAGYKPYDFGTEFLDTMERDTFLRVLRHIADTAIKAGCRDLLLQDLETLTALEEKNEAMFLEWLDR